MWTFGGKRTTLWWTTVSTCSFQSSCVTLSRRMIVVALLVMQFSCFNSIWMWKLAIQCDMWWRDLMLLYVKCCFNMHSECVSLDVFAETTMKTIEDSFKEFTNREDIAIVLISQYVSVLTTLLLVA